MRSLSLKSISLGFLLLTSSSDARNLFHFGDSYSTTAFNPHGAQPSKSNPIGNPAFPGRTYAGGINFIGDLIKAHPTGSNNTPTLVYNYAYPGAVVNSTLENSNRSIPDFVTQVQQFTSTRPHFDPANDVFSVYFGTNDINGFSQQPHNQTTQIFSRIQDSLVECLGELLALGARHFIIFEMDPLWRVPDISAVLSPPPALTVPKVKDAVHVWNSLLPDKINGWITAAYKAAAADLAAFNAVSPVHLDVKMFSTMGYFNTVLDDPQAYGAPNNYCSDADGRTCLWWDGLHPGFAIHKSLAGGFEGVLSQFGFFG